MRSLVVRVNALCILHNYSKTVLSLTPFLQIQSKSANIFVVAIL